MGAVGRIISLLEKHGNKIRNSFKYKKKFNKISENLTDFNKQFDDSENLNNNGQLNGEDEG